MVLPAVTRAQRAASRMHPASERKQCDLTCGKGYYHTTCYFKFAGSCEACAPGQFKHLAGSLSFDTTMYMVARTVPRADTVLNAAATRCMRRCDTVARHRWSTRL